MAAPPIPLKPFEIKVSEDGSMVRLAFAERSGRTVAFEISLDAFDDLMIAFQTAAKMAHERFRTAAVEAARSGKARALHG